MKTLRSPPCTVFRAGMTLIEMLVATAATLMIMGAIAQVFSVFGSAVSNSRSMIELDGQMRNVAWRLREDLSGATARTVPPLEPQAGEGYFELIEGPARDSDAANGTAALAADIDDVLLFTTRSVNAPFVGKAGSYSVESSVAEVAWFLRPTAGTAAPITYTLFRRQLLVVGYAGLTTWAPKAPYYREGNYFETDPARDWTTFYSNYDISARLMGDAFFPNTLSDLTRRESRFLHRQGAFPYAFPEKASYQAANAPTGLIFTTDRAGEDVVLANVIAFDVRVFDPAVSIGVSGNDAVVAGDPGYVVGTANGAYVDLGHGEAAAGASGIASHFSGQGIGNYRKQDFGMAGLRTWDTWSTHYESNGVDEDGVARADQGSNGLDDQIGTVPGALPDSWAQNGRVDEPEEQETSPPYPFPLRGIEVRIRAYEPSSRQVRQVTVRHTFVPH
jgi:type II secretory pathway component PulJ